MRILSLDIGDRRIGVAISDATGLIARPLGIFSRKGTASDTQAVAEFVREHEVGLVIIGMPISLGGHYGPQAEKVKKFGESLGASLSIPLKFWDERFSTSTARQQRLESGSPKKKRRSPDDDAAAAVILQSYLDSTRL